MAGLLALPFFGFSQSLTLADWHPSPHYRELQQFSAQPSAPGLAIDELRFRSPGKEQLERLEQATLHYLKGLTIEAFGVPDPPANSSEQTQKELDYLVALQNKRSEEDIRRSQYLAGVYFNPRAKPDDKHYRAYRDNLFSIGRQTGLWFNQDSLPVTTEVLARVMTDANYYNWKLKLHYLRPRPWVLDTRIKNLENADWSPYPSGHSNTGYTLAYIYSAIAPEFGFRYLEDAFEMAYSREILGVHYPSDSEASRMYALRFVELLLATEAFQKDLEAMKEEWKRVRKEN